MEEMSRRNRELFQLPTWVLYVVRAFSTLEGIGLSDGCSPRILLLTHGAVVWHRHVDSSSPRFEVAGDASSQPVSFRLSLSAAESSEACSLAVAPVWTAMLLAMLLGMLWSRQTRW